MTTSVEDVLTLQTNIAKHLKAKMSHYEGEGDNRKKVGHLRVADAARLMPLAFVAYYDHYDEDYVAENHVGRKLKPVGGQTN
jgi:hypothetical protein